MKGAIRASYFWSKSDTFDLCRDLVCCESSGCESLNNVEKQCFRGSIGDCRRAIHIADVGGICEFDFEDLLYLGLASIAETLSITLIHQHFVVIEREDFTHA